jgi:hypothetical protein
MARGRRGRGPCARPINDHTWEEASCRHCRAKTARTSTTPPWPPSATSCRRGTPGRASSLVFCTPGGRTARRRWWSARPPRTAYAGKSNPPSGNAGYGRDRRRDRRRSGRPPHRVRGFRLHVRLGVGERRVRAGRKTPVRQPWNLADHVMERRRASDADPRRAAPWADLPGPSGRPRYLPR